MTSLGPLALYRRKKMSGELRHDPWQELAAEKLEHLHQALKSYRPSHMQTWSQRLGFGRQKRSAVQGLYMYGDVGRGKSMLMDLFFQALLVPSEHKRRVHFHAFMAEVHRRLHAERQKKISEEPLLRVAKDIATETWVLCFDEFHVTDIADAMILSRLFSLLFDDGVIVVATSNWAPDDLYKDGLQRSLFLPFIALLKETLDILALNGSTDYRLHRLQGQTTYFSPLSLKTPPLLARIFAELTDGAPPRPDTLIVAGRTLTVSRAAPNVGWLTFQEICERPLGAADYTALATHYATVLIENVPMMGDEKRNEAKRFMTLIDILYEHKVKVVITAEAEPERLYPHGQYAFEFQRTASRLVEMQSAEYLEVPHLT